MIIYLNREFNLTEEVEPICELYCGLFLAKQIPTNFIRIYHRDMIKSYDTRETIRDGRKESIESKEL